MLDSGREISYVEARRQKDPHSLWLQAVERRLAGGWALLLSASTFAIFHEDNHSTEFIFKH